MAANRFTEKVQRDWELLRGDLNALADLQPVAALKRREHRTQGLAAVAERKLLCGRGLPERAPESGAVEQRVVPEAASAAPVFQQDAIHRAAVYADHAIRFH
jgi:hypothetical protein